MFNTRTACTRIITCVLGKLPVKDMIVQGGLDVCLWAIGPHFAWLANQSVNLHSQLTVAFVLPQTLAALALAWPESLRLRREENDRYRTYLILGFQ